MKHKHYSQEQIDRLSKDPRVKHIDETRLVFTLDFRTELWETVTPNYNIASIREALIKFGFDIQDIQSDEYFCHHIKTNFKKRKPCSASNKTFGQSSNNLNADKTYNDYLLNTGKFIKSSNGISFTEIYKNEIYHTYPEVSIEDYLKKDGFDIERIGYQRIYQLKREFDEEGPKSESYSEDLINMLKSHPYIKTCTYKQIRFHPHFYNEAYYLNSMSMDDILETFGMDYRIIPISLKQNLKYKLLHWQRKTVDYELPCNEQTIQIQRNIQDKLIHLIQQNFKQVKDNIATLNYKGRKSLCEIIQAMPKDEERVYTKKKIFKLIGISKTNYYAIINNPEYGTYQKLKEEQDMKDIEMIQKVIDYKGYPKGNRMIHMMLPMLCKTSMSRSKIRRLCRKANIQCVVRKANQSSRSARELLARNVKPNLLKRQFRLARPNQIYLTDVTYLKYGKNQIAYLSDIKDAVTGRICAHVVSDSNDLSLALNTLEKLGDVNKDAIFHSDQGSQYLSTDFQQILSDDAFVQSMSARGNSQDNAPMESFFGRMKANIIDLIALCPTLEVVMKLIDGYMHSYNTEQYQYPLAGLTPCEFYLYSMTGIYPLDNYYGVKASELMSIEDLVNKRMAEAKAKQDRIKENNRKKREEKAKLSSALLTVNRDEKLVKKEIEKWEKSKDVASKQVSFLNEIKEEITNATKFILDASKELREELRNPQAWKNYPELNYVNKLEALF